MRSTGKTFLLTAGVTVVLLLMYWLPTVSLGDVETRPVRMLSDLFPEDDSLSADSVDVVSPQTFPPVPLYQPEGVTLIDDFGEGQAGGMDHLYDRLLHVKGQGGHVYMAYFGDSFIENDILTCDLREMLQSEYGGCGVGWVDCGGGVGTQKPTVRTSFSQMTENVCLKKPFHPELQLLSQRYYYAANGATIELKGVKFRQHVDQWTQATLFFATDTALLVEVKKGGGQYEPVQFAPSSEVQALLTTDTMKSVAYRFPQANGRTRFFGVALDGDSGVALDNYSMRSSPGFKLASVPVSTMKSLARHRPYDLIILQFGLNVVDDHSSDAQCRHYINRMKKVISHLREAFPEASILVFSASDRDQRSASGLHTLKGIKRLVGYQRKLAEECGVGFFNLYQAMGGDDSMVGYVEKGLAGKDYTHMNYKGGKVVADLIFQSLKAGVENYRRRTENVNETAQKND